MPTDGLQTRVGVRAEDGKEQGELAVRKTRQGGWTAWMDCEMEMADRDGLPHCMTLRLLCRRHHDRIRNLILFSDGSFRSPEESRRPRHPGLVVNIAALDYLSLIHI